MSRLIEFNVGDPKNNQQTASKVDCKIIINNENVPRRQTEDSHRKNNANDDIGVGVETFETNEDVTARSLETHEKQSTSKNSKVLSEAKPKLSVPVKCTHRSVPSSVSRYVMVSRQPVVTAEEIDNNIEFHKKLNDILIRRVTEKVNFKQMLSELLDNNERIILKGADLCALISVLLSNDEFQVLDTDINITYHTDTFVSCFKSVELPFKTIDSIKINNQDFKSVQNEAYNVLTDVYKISLNHFIV